MLINDEVELLMMLRNGESVESEGGETKGGGGGEEVGRREEKGKMSEQRIEFVHKKNWINLLPAYAVNITDKKKGANYGTIVRIQEDST